MPCTVPSRQPYLTREFVPTAGWVSGHLKNFHMEDHSADGQATILQVRRPMSQRFAQRLSDLFDAASVECRFSFPAEFPDASQLPQLREMLMV